MIISDNSLTRNAGGSIIAVLRVSFFGPINGKGAAT